MSAWRHSSARSRVREWAMVTVQSCPSNRLAIAGRKSPISLYDQETATFEADTVYDQRDAEGFIKLNALRLRLMKKGRG